MTEEDKKFAEKRRLFLEECYQEDDPTAVVVTVFGDVAYDTNPVILDYQAKGFRFVDANAFGCGPNLIGENLVFSKTPKK